MIFVDTGAFLARYLRQDQYHGLACSGWKRIAVKKETCLTSNFVLDELFTLLARRADHAFSAETARTIYHSGVFEILRPGFEDELEALRFLEKYADQKVGFTDCVSFALMRRRGIKRVFSFDHHFARAGFVLWPWD
jgi:uncharacterized protein